MKLTASLLSFAKRKNRQLDVVLFGASGFSGRLILDELAKVCGTKSQTNPASNVEETAGKTGSWPLRWGVAGRNDEKLKCAVKDVENRLGTCPVEIWSFKNMFL